MVLGLFHVFIEHILNVTDFINAILHDSLLFANIWQLVHNRAILKKKACGEITGALYHPGCWCYHGNRVGTFFPRFFFFGFLLIIHREHTLFTFTPMSSFITLSALLLFSSFHLILNKLEKHFSSPQEHWQIFKDLKFCTYSTYAYNLTAKIIGISEIIVHPV